MEIINNESDMNIPHISNELAEYLASVFSADKQLSEGLLADPNVVRSESYLLGFLAGLGYSQSVIRTMLDNQNGKYEELVDVTENYLN